MVDNFAGALRQLRQAAGYSQHGLSDAAFVSRSLLSRVELGTLPPTNQFAAACDRALGTTPLLTTLAAIGDDEMKRRTILTHIGSASGVGALTGAGGLAEVVRAGLLDQTGLDHDWDYLVDDYRHRLTVDGSFQFGQSLLARLMMARQQLVEKGASPIVLRAVADLGLIYGLWLGNTGDLPAAHGWYRTAGSLATSSGDDRLASYVIGRSAARGIYEGWSVGRTLGDAQRALDLANGRAWQGAVEAQAARAHVHALTGDAASGRAAVAAMLDLAERAADDSARARALFVQAFTEARYGTVHTATAAFAEAEPALAARPLWDAEARVYLGRAMVAAGDVVDGCRLALSAVEGLRSDVRVVGVAVRDLVCSAPAGTVCRELVELRRYADRVPGPWETLR